MIKIVKLTFHIELLIKINYEKSIFRVTKNFIKWHTQSSRYQLILN